MMAEQIEMFRTETWCSECQAELKPSEVFTIALTDKYADLTLCKICFLNFDYKEWDAEIISILRPNKGGFQ